MDQWRRKGIYQKSSTINGRESWTSEFDAIWYSQEYWMIGSLNDIGKTIGGFYSFYGNKCPFHIQSDYWYYSSVDGWTNANATDINIYCLKGKSNIDLFLAYCFHKKVMERSVKK